MTLQPDGTYRCPICGREAHTAMFAALHAQSFHQPQQPTPQQQPDAQSVFTALVQAGQAHS